MATQETPKNPKQIEAMERRRTKFPAHRKNRPRPTGDHNPAQHRAGRPQKSRNAKGVRAPLQSVDVETRGKTVTVNLSASQLKPYQHAIAENRKLEDLLQELREVSLNILEAKTECVSKRSRNSSQAPKNAYPNSPKLVPFGTVPNDGTVLNAKAPQPRTGHSNQTNHLDPTQPTTRSGPSRVFKAGDGPARVARQPRSSELCKQRQRRGLGSPSCRTVLRTGPASFS